MQPADDYAPKPFFPNRAVLDAILVKQAEAAVSAAISGDDGVRKMVFQHANVIYEVGDVISKAFPPRDRREPRQESPL